MLELAADLLSRLRAGERVSVVTVTHVGRSAPRGLGASMAVTEAGDVVGSISGGCVEGDSVALAHQVLSDGMARRASFGFSDESAHAAGLACGGSVDVLAYVIAPDDAAASDALEGAVEDRPVTIALGIEGADLGRMRRAADLAARAPGAARGIDEATALAESRRIDSAGESWLVLARAPRARMIIAGAGEHAAALCRVASAAGFAVTVCDPWELLLTRERFPDATERVVAMPAEYLGTLGREPDATDARTAVCVLTHDERLDIPALHVALSMNVGFVGAMGARNTVEHRARLLRERGVTTADLARLHSPLGLDLGGSSPEVAAVAVVAEILAARHGASARPLRETRGPIHARPHDGAACEVPPAPAPS